MGRPVKKAKVEVVDTGYDNPVGEANTYGVVAGDTAQTKPTISCTVKIGGNAEADGWIVRQRGARKFLVTDGVNTGVCVLADSEVGSLANDTMVIIATKADTSTVNLSKVSGRFGLDFAGNKYVLSFNDAGPAPAGTTTPVVKVTSM